MEQHQIERHKYTDLLVSMSVELYASCGCGFRSIEKILNYLNSKLQWGLEDVPCYVSIKNWVEKSGYSIYCDPELKTQSSGYATIVDESMMIGSEKLLLTLGVKSDKIDIRPLKFNDVNVLDISVRKSWNSTSIADVFSKIEDKMGLPPTYVISDNASTITKAIRDKSYIHVRDVSHTMSMFVERQYKNDASFIAFTKEIAAVKFKEIMRPSSYLLPPKQRTIARFMNLSQSVDWAERMLKSFNRLSDQEQQIFGFLHNHILIIRELSEILERINLVSKRIKNEGISMITINNCKKELYTLTLSSSQRVSTAAKQILYYLDDENNKLTNDKTIWNASSDIIESIFGHYKTRKSPDTLNGVTLQVLLLPLMTKIDTENGISTINFKTTLEQIFLRDLKDWKDDHLTENMAIKRNKIRLAS